ncbi:membrane-associated phospholipid phosphatase [Marmoricola sp. OAE513]|uniref:phosphatase PAP2 family protein n=1 Tax=Marmoricola sp. OAE513 TaxID=2817894 RepID=UPI001AE4C66E
MGIDRAVTEFFADHRSAHLTDLMWSVTWLGNASTLHWAMIGLAATTLVLGRPFQAAAVVVGMVGASDISGSIKDLVGRDRPGSEFRAGDALSSYAFPSGHTMGMTVLVGLVLMVAWRSLRTDRARRTAVGLGAVVVLAVGLSRIYLGYHWLTDVLAGLCFGLLWIATVVASARGVKLQWAAAAERGWSEVPATVPVRQYLS